MLFVWLVDMYLSIRTLSVVLFIILKMAERSVEGKSYTGCESGNKRINFSFKWKTVEVNGSNYLE